MISFYLIIPMARTTQKLIENKVRLQIMRIISNQNVNISFICNELNKKQSTIYEHLVDLIKLNYIIKFKQNNIYFYKINKNKFNIEIERKLKDLTIKYNSDIDFYTKLKIN